MSPHSQRVAILEWLGWKQERQPHNNGKAVVSLVRWVDPTGWRPCEHFVVEGSGELGYLPNFPNDLNAMLDATNKLDEKQAMEFCFALQKVVCGGCSLVTGPLVVNATAPQRAEALLRMLGLWRDEEGAP